ncbi:thioredoxin domain-containing protein, partial [Candidatus Woesearchaeota archaeon]|nr:thioredoxin domain-containing protein [Candidatus Woesearchaeota archaeon]
HFPLDFHENAQIAAEASECAREQGKFWEYHDKIFENQISISQNYLQKWAGELGLDTEQFNDCLTSGKYSDKVNKDKNDGIAAGVSGTPTFFVNGKKIVGAQPFSVFQQAIESGLGGTCPTGPCETIGDCEAQDCEAIAGIGDCGCS